MAGLMNYKTLYNDLRVLPLALKVVLLTVSFCAMVWLAGDWMHRRGMDGVFKDFLQQELRQIAVINQERFDDYLRTQDRFARLLVQRGPLLSHVTLHWDQPEGGKSVVVPIHHRDPPQWLADKDGMHGLTPGSQILLVDAGGVLRETFHAGGSDTVEVLPSELLRNLLSRDDRETVFASDDGVYLSIYARVMDPAGMLKAFLVVLIPLQESFLVHLSRETSPDVIMAFVHQDGRRVLASSRPGLVPSGSLMASLEQKYLLQKQIIFGYSFPSTTRIPLATLVSLDRMVRVNQRVDEIDHHVRALSFGMLLVLFFGMVPWWVGRIRAYTVEMSTFAKEHLGLEPIQGVGRDHLTVMGEQFRLMKEAIIEGRKRLEERERELTMANKSLWESLVMVKRAQSKLFESEKMAYLGSLVAGVAHEINTPVGIGITAASFLEEKCRDIHALCAAGTMKKSDLIAFVGDARESSEMVLNNLQRAAELIRSFKQVAVDQSNEEKRRFNINDYINHIFKSLQPRLKNKKIIVSTVCPKDLQYYGLPGVLSQIVTNLVENSLKHGFDADESGKIHVSVEPFAGKIRLTYSDTGRGIAEDSLQHIFEPFFTTARNQGGSGLGLHIVYNLVTQTLGGSIDCQSSPGNGVSFVMEFQAHEESLNG
ncbi:MAG: HAMP domain-containing histidine kinase [Magnetococcales bacterium]|nr:HAMP domain-containing histidine kinase [Magnetococcales bacterium]